MLPLFVATNCTLTNSAIVNDLNLGNNLVKGDDFEPSPLDPEKDSYTFGFRTRVAQEKLLKTSFDIKAFGHSLHGIKAYPIRAPPF